jgi:hypothetical protein
VSSSGLIDSDQQVFSSAVLPVSSSRAGAAFISGPKATQVIIGNRQLHAHLAEILALRRRCGQEDDLTTEPEYFIAANAVANRKCAAVLIRGDQELEACVFFYEHCRFGIGLGLFRGGDYMGESLVAGPEPLRLQYAHLATQALLKRSRVHGVSITIKSSATACTGVMGPGSQFRRFRGTEVQHKLPLASTYEGMLASLGPRTRRSLAGKRQQLEKSANVQFIASLEPQQALEVMLDLEAKAMPQFFSCQAPLAAQQVRILLHGTTDAGWPVAEPAKRLAT